MSQSTTFGFELAGGVERAAALEDDTNLVPFEL